MVSMKVFAKCPGSVCYKSKYIQFVPGWAMTTTGSALSEAENLVFKP